MGHVLFAALAACSLHAQDDQDSKARMKVMAEAIAAFEGRSSDIVLKDALTFSEKPLLRYSDPTRGLTKETVLLDASVWRLGKGGRPTALVTLEIYRSGADTGALAYEFLSLTPRSFSLDKQGRNSVGWDATGSALELHDFKDAPEPAKTPAARLIQMRQLAKRFTATETVDGKPILCRLLTQPIDRYQSEDGKIVDGALFAFANATNPETGLFLECDATRWSWGIVRLSSAEAKIELDGVKVASYPFFGEYGRRDGAYTSASHPIDLPK
jgi:hypothetical protein